MSRASQIEPDSASSPGVSLRPASACDRRNLWAPPCKFRVREAVQDGKGHARRQAPPLAGARTASTPALMAWPAERFPAQTYPGRDHIGSSTAGPNHVQLRAEVAGDGLAVLGLAVVKTVSAPLALVARDLEQGASEGITITASSPQSRRLRPPLARDCRKSMRQRRWDAAWSTLETRL